MIEEDNYKYSRLTKKNLRKRHKWEMKSNLMVCNNGILFPSFTGELVNNDKQKNEKKSKTLSYYSNSILLFGYMSSIIGWYGYKKWTYRVASTSIEESKSNGVLVKKMNFEVDSFSGKIVDFCPYIERGFRYDRHSSKKNHVINDSKYSYQLTFNSRPSDGITILIRESELSKFDSSDASWGYLRDPQLKDTIILDIYGENNQHGIIKVWE